MNQTLKTKEEKRTKLIKDLLIMTFGMMGGAFAVHCFLQPLALIIGSISGLSIVIEHLTSIPVSYSYLVINIGLLILAYFLIGAEFGLKTVFTSLITAPWLLVFEKIMPIQKASEIMNSAGEVFNAAGEKVNDAWYVIMTIPKTGLTGSIWYDLVCFIVILSIGQTILFNINASTGGLDIIAKIINKYTSLNLGICVAISGALLCSTAFFIHPVEIVLIGLTGTVLNGVTLSFLTRLLTRMKVRRAKRISTISI